MPPVPFLIEVLDSTSARACERSDWRGDEPRMRRRDRDCRVARETGGARCTGT